MTDKKERFKLIPEVYLVLRRGDDILLSRRYQTGYEDGHYSLVAGHAEEHETMREALAREALEETDIVINPVDLRHRLTMHRSCGDHERIGLYFTADKWSGDIRNAEPQKCDDVAWFPIDRLPENTIPYVRYAIGCCLDGVTYCEFDWGGTGDNKTQNL